MWCKVVVVVEALQNRSFLRSESVSNVVIIDPNFSLRSSAKEKLEFGPTQPQLVQQFI